MSDSRMRELERAAAGGDLEAARALGELLVRIAGRDPRRDPRPGDRVRVPKHGRNLVRWDERRVVSCIEASGWEDPMVRCCPFWRGGTPVPERVGGFTGLPCGQVHWSRDPKEFKVLLEWGLAREKLGTMERVGSWRRWALRAEVVEVAGGS